MGLKVTDLNEAFSVSVEDLLTVVNSPDSPDAETVKISFKNVFANFPANTWINATLIANVFRVNNTWSPTSSSAPCTKGKIAYDSNYLYVAVANNTVKRITLSSF